MSNLLGIIETITVDEEGSVWVLCQPITESAPKDIPKIESIANEYWTAKIIAKTQNSNRQITEWFSMPYKNIQRIVENGVDGPCVINYGILDDDSKQMLFENTSPVFSLSERKSNESFRWLDR